jgi:hypothetical protein
LPFITHTFNNHDYDIIIFFAFSLWLILLWFIPFIHRARRFHKVENNELAFLRVHVKMKTRPKRSTAREREKGEASREERKKKPEIPFRDYAKCRSSRAARRKNN